MLLLPRGHQPAHEGQPQRDLLDPGRPAGHVEAAERAAHGVGQGQDGDGGEGREEDGLLDPAQGDGEPGVAQRDPPCCFRYSSR